jgi:hypothetical protein
MAERPAINERRESSICAFFIALGHYLQTLKANKTNPAQVIQATVRPAGLT